MKKGNSNRTRIIGLRLTPSEYAKIERKWKASTCRKLSDYVRRSLFDKPIVTTYRDASLDEFMLQMIQLRKELNAIGNNFNQAVKKLHILQQIPEFKSWLIRYDLESKILFNKIDDVKKNIQKFAELWLR